MNGQNLVQYIIDISEVQLPKKQEAIEHLAAMQARIEKLTEYPERLQKAITELEALITPTLSRSQQERIAGKIEGVKLALGYFEEMTR